ncbi:MAG: DUF362 domain-containing protein [Candidatus Bathyarchaeota archaeon]|nr:DUF362 domain-containing protein [Candidatus Bathyarchaeota archaeon]
MSSKIWIGKTLSNPFVKDGRPLISEIKATQNPKQDILKAVNAIGGFEKIINKGDRVLVKPNYNSADPPPASTEPGFLKAIVELLYAHGAGKVVVGESSWQALKTREVLEKTGALAALEGTGAEIAFFDEGNYVKVDVGGEYLGNVNLTEQAMGFDKLVYSCCMKTHFRADFSLSLKLAFGFTKKSDRVEFHLRHLKEKLVDLNLVVHPNLIIMDGRVCFISGGPFNGEVRKPNLVMASGDRVAMDVEAIKVIAGFEGSTLTDDPWSYTQIRRATALGLGVKSENEYIVVTD